MNKAFIFDMDGVIVNSEPVWERYEQKFLPELMGKDNYVKMKDQILGNSVSGIYEVASKFGLNTAKNEFERIYDQYAEIVYREAKITNGMQALIDKLILKGFTLGLVSSSRQYWIDLVIKRLNGENLFKSILSLDGDAIRPKPFPDGYLEMIKRLGSKPNLTFILEDSQRGVNAAKSSGALTICLQEYLLNGYLPENADFYTKTIMEVIKQVENI
jgi:HAD superfamily hydrolase (TIGR01509 family)